MAGFHHVEIWVADLEQARLEWGWLLARMGFSLESEWLQGQSWGAGGAYLTITTSPNVVDAPHHLAFDAGAAGEVDAIMADASAHGWRPLYNERYPHAGGPAHYAGWLENSAGFKVEVVAG